MSTPEAGTAGGTPLPGDPAAPHGTPVSQDPAPGGAAGPSRALLLALGAVTVVLALLAVVLVVQLRGYSQTGSARQAALVAARQSALNLTSIDTREFDADIKRVADGSTGAFLADFQMRVKDPAFRSALVDSKVVSEGKVLEAGLVRSDARNATALVIVDSTVQNTAAPEGRANTYRMQLELELRDGRWLTSSLEFVA